MFQIFFLKYFYVYFTTCYANSIASSRHERSNAHHYWRLENINNNNKNKHIIYSPISTVHMVGFRVAIYTHRYYPNIRCGTMWYAREFCVHLSLYILFFFFRKYAYCLHRLWIWLLYYAFSHTYPKDVLFLSRFFDPTTSAVTLVNDD